MLRMFCRWLPAIVVTGCLLASSAARAQDMESSFPCRDRDFGNPDLFYNFWVPPGCGQVGAHLYVAPQPVPPLVGHTYITYQPLMPHEFMYPHLHTYYRYYDGGRGMTRAAVHYYNPPLRTALRGAVTQLRIPR